MPIESAEDLKQAKSYLGQTSLDEQTRARLQAKVKEYELRQSGGTHDSGTGRRVAEHSDLETVREGPEPQREGIAGLAPGLMPPVAEEGITELPDGKVPFRSHPTMYGMEGGGNMPDAAPPLSPTDQKAANAVTAGNAFQPPPPEWIPQRPLGIRDKMPTEIGGKLGFWVDPGVTQYRAEMMQEVERMLPQAKGAQAAMAQGKLPPEAIMQFQTILSTYDDAVQRAEDASKAVETSPAFQDWKNRKWAAELEKHAANPDAGPLIRYDAVPKDKWKQKAWQTQVGGILHEGMEHATAFGTSAVNTATVGLAEGPQDALFGSLSPRMREKHPISSLLGNVLGVLSPASALGNAGKYLYNKAAPHVGKALAGAASGAGMAVAEGTGGDISAAYPELFIPAGSQLKGQSHRFGEDETTKLIARLLFGGIGGKAGGWGSYKAEVKNAADDLVEGAWGRGIRPDSEAAGFRPKLSGGIEMPEEAIAVAQEAKRRGPGVKPNDVLALGAAKKMTDEHAIQHSGASNDIQTFRQSYEATPEGQITQDMTPMIRAFDAEIAAATQGTGAEMVGTQRAALLKDKWKLFDPKPAAVLLPDKARGVALKYPGSVQLDEAAYRALPIADPELSIPEGFSVVLKPARFTPAQIEKQLGHLQKTIRPGEKEALHPGQIVQAFEKADIALREMRDKMQWPAEWTKKGILPPEEVYEVAEGGAIRKVKLKGISAKIRQLGKVLDDVNQRGALAGMKSDEPWSRQKLATEREPLLDSLKNSPKDSEARRAAKLSFTDEDSEKYLRMMTALQESATLAPAGGGGSLVAGTNGMRAIDTISGARGANSMRALLKQLSEDDPKGPGVIRALLDAVKARGGGAKGALMAGKEMLPFGRKKGTVEQEAARSRMPSPRSLAIAPLSIGRGRPGGVAGAIYNNRERDEGFTEEDMLLLEQLLEAYKKGQQK
jgi:hypothetical protein